MKLARQIEFTIGFLSVITGLGFYLSMFYGRRQIRTESSSNFPFEHFDQSNTNSDNRNESWFGTPQKVIFYLFDALDFQFAYTPEQQQQQKSYEKKLTVFQNLLEQEPENSILLQAKVDFPTFTITRMKTLLTGTYYSDTDCYSSYCDYEIKEDHIFNQAVKNNKKYNMTGWIQYKNFLPKFANPNTVHAHQYKMEWNDTLVRRDFETFLADKSYDFIFVHNDDIDEIGHVLGDDNDIMQKKLVNDSDYLENIIKNLEPDTVFIVIGDHGMQHGGGHGGDD